VRRPCVRLSSLLLAAGTLSAAAPARALELPERRKEQKQTTPGHILTPAAANIPGIGFTYGILGSLFNVKESEADVLGFRFFGDLAGYGAGVVDLPLGTDLLTLNVFINDFDRVGVESYRRGIDSEADDRTIVELDRFAAYVGQLNLRLFERRLQLLAGMNKQTARLASIRDKDGNLITEGNGETNGTISRSLGAFVDLADDRSDPRKGAQLEAYRYDRPAPPEGEADYYTMEYNATGYIPVGAFNTFVVNAYRADAELTRAGETDETKIKEKLAFHCESVEAPDAKAQCETTEGQYVKEQAAANKHGTGPSLGGTQRLRSYVTNRFSAAHAAALGAEFRWNLTEEFTPFNIFVASGVRTGIQLAFFGEGGTVADYVTELDEDWKYSYGAGVRFILASGFVVRFDVAAGDEGTQPTLIFAYPWNIF
jgi:hypothetical protein